jgi:hypothetical protein
MALMYTNQVFPNQRPVYWTPPPAPGQPGIDWEALLWTAGAAGLIALRQGDAKVFKKYSQMKLQMKREALAKLNRQANEGGCHSPAEHKGVLTQLCHRRGKGQAKVMERGPINSFQINERYGRGGAI